MNDRPSVRQLEYVVAVAEELHFGRAARRCAVTQPALSAQIAQLEEALGVRLFERGHGRVLITPEGERLLGPARAALRELDELVEAARTLGRPLAGPLRLGVIPTVAPFVLPPLLTRVRRALPELELLLREDQTARLVAALEEGRLDLLLLALPVEEAELDELPLFEEPFLFAAPEGHPLTRRARVAERALEGEEVLLLEDGHCLRAQTLDVCARAGAREAARVQATSLSTLVQMVANGLGVTLLPERSIPVLVGRGSGVAVRPFRAPAPGRTIGLAWRRGAAREAAYRELGALLAREAARLAPQAGGSRAATRPARRARST